MLQVIDDKKARKMEVLRDDVEDAKDTASHAHRFNLHLQRALGGEGGEDEVPQVKVAVPAACFVIGGSSNDVAQPGDAVLLHPYSPAEVQKYLFDGGEDFLELPQAFFHYTACQTSGMHFLCDLQGAEDENGSFLLVDPVVLRAPRPGLGDILGSLPGGSAFRGGCPTVGPSPERFDQLHPRCGGLCKAFDPQRKSGNQRRSCGLAQISCGVGGA
jgi:hypothetical protein